MFFCFVVGSVLLRNASELIFGQTGPSHLHGFCSTWKETSIKLCFIPEQPCWFLMFALMHLTLIQCCLICLSVFYHVCLSKSVLAKIITWIDSFSIAASFTTDVLKCISDSNTSHHRCSSSLPFPQILSRLISSVLFFLMEFSSEMKIPVIQMLRCHVYGSFCWAFCSGESGDRSGLLQLLSLVDSPTASFSSH